VVDFNQIPITAPSGAPKGIREKVSFYAQQNGIPDNIAQALAKQESGFNSKAVSKAGARGVLQLMPDTAKALGVIDSFDPDQNIEAGTRYLKGLKEQFGTWDLALAAYNSGPGRVAKLGRIPNIKETQNYVRSIANMANRRARIRFEDIPIQQPVQQEGPQVPVIQSAGTPIEVTADTVTESPVGQTEFSPERTIKGIRIVDPTNTLKKSQLDAIDKIIQGKASITTKKGEREALGVSGEKAKLGTIAADGLFSVERLADRLIKKDESLFLPGVLNRSLDSVRDDITDMVGRLRSGGAINEGEEKRFLRLLPSFLDSEATRINKLKRMKSKFKVLGVKASGKEQFNKDVKLIKSAFEEDPTSTPIEKAPLTDKANKLREEISVLESQLERFNTSGN